jgi:Replication-relaxation
MWRILGLLAALIGLSLAGWFIGGGPGRVLRGNQGDGTLHLTLSALASTLARQTSVVWSWTPAPGPAPARLLVALAGVLTIAIASARGHVRRRRRYVRLRIEVYRTDRADAEAVVRMFDALHKRLLRRWWRRMVLGQPSVALEVHHTGAGAASSGWLAVSCPEGFEPMVEAALRGAYPNCRLSPAERSVGVPPTVLRLKKHASFIKRVKALDRFERDWEPPVNGMLTVMGAGGESAFVQIAMTPAPALFEAFSKHLYKRHETRLSRERRGHLFVRDRSMVEDSELRGGLEVQHRPLFFVDLRVIAPNRGACERIASELRLETAENRLVERGTAVRHGVFGVYGRRVQRGEGNPLPSIDRGVFATTELAAIWQMPSVDYLTVPFARTGLPVAPAPPGICRPRDGGTLRDARGAVSIHVEMRKQNTAVPGTVEQGKSSYLVATVAEDVRRERCALIVLDPKGDAAEAAVSVVPAARTCTMLDFAHPTCGFNPLAVDAPADVIADYVVAALKNLFSDADIRASSDRYLRNAIIAVLAYDRGSTLWDAARLLSVGEEGYSYRSSVGAKVRTQPEFKEISQFFTAELTAQLADARSTTTAKLDAPVNKLARLLNSPSIKRILLNDSLRVDFDQVIAGEEVLVVKGALGAMGAGNTSVLMQLLVGMLDAALARQQDLVPADRRVAVALKIDEAPLVLNRGFAETMALKRSAGLETVACWQTDAQWIDRDVREQLDALFSHRVYFATASARDARSAVALTMAEFSDTIRPGIGRLSSLGHPDVRLHLPKHHAIVSWSTEEGRQPSFIAQTIPLRVDHERLALHAAHQHERGGRHLTDLRQPHWDSPHPRQRAPGEAPVRTGVAPGPLPPSGSGSQEGARDRPPESPAESYRELVDLDRAQSVRSARTPSSRRALTPDPLDLEMLALIASLRHVLTSQIHRRFNAGRAATTTQRRLKRLSDAGLVERIQFHRRDGGGVPMCHTITAEGLELLLSHEARLPTSLVPRSVRSPVGPSSADSRQRLRQARHDVHVAGWVLALATLLGDSGVTLRGPEESALFPPERATASGRIALAPAELRLPGGRVAHDFLRTDSTGQRVELERFDTLRPDAVVELSGQVPGIGGQGGHGLGPAVGIVAEPSQAPNARRTPATDVILECDDRLPVGRAAAKLERYDHFLAGWSVHTNRYGRRLEAEPVVVFACRDRARARECARAADSVLRACRAYAGEYPFDWEYPGRQRILFASERDVHERLLDAYGVPRLPPDVRVAAAHGDPRARETSVERRTILGTAPPAGE